MDISIIYALFLDIYLRSSAFLPPRFHKFSLSSSWCSGFTALSCEDGSL